MSSSSQIFSLIAGQISNAAFTAPTDPHINVPPKAIFGKMFSNILTSLTNSPTGNNFGNNQLQGLTGINPQTLQAFNNARPNGGIQSFTRSQTGPAIFQGPLSNNQLAGGLQGFGGQQGNAQQPFLPSGPIGFPGIGLPNAGGGKLQLLIYPVLGLFTAVKSVFGLRKMIHGTNGLKVNKEALAFNKTSNVFEDYAKDEGSFDEFYFPEETISNDYQPDFEKLNAL